MSNRTQQLALEYDKLRWKHWVISMVAIPKSRMIRSKTLSRKLIRSNRHRIYRNNSKVKSPNKKVIPNRSIRALMRIYRERKLFSRWSHLLLTRLIRVLKSLRNLSQGSRRENQSRISEIAKNFKPYSLNATFCHPSLAMAPLWNLL